jgi:hypothetical protein
MRQILIHPGFHKTGTSSIQHYLWLNREVLEPHLSLLMLRHMKPVVKDCARFSRTGNPMDLVDLVSLLDDAVSENPPHPDRHLVVSSEGLSGHLPGWPGVPDYAAVPMMTSYIVGYFGETFPTADVRVVFTTRDGEGWLFSAYRHHLKGYRLTQDYVDFARAHEGATALDKMAAEVAEAIAPVPVETLSMTDALQHPLGPGAALVGKLPIPAGALVATTPVGRGNEGPGDNVWKEYLALNRSDLTDDEVQARKTELAEKHSVGGWRRI